MRALAESMGGRLLGFYYSFGEYDGFAIFEAPDSHSAGTASLTAVAILRFNQNVKPHGHARSR